MTARDSPFDEPGRVFGAAFVVAMVAFVLALAGTVALAFVLPGTPQFTATDPPTLALLGSWTGMWSSMLCYSVWSFRRLRALPVDSAEFERRTLPGRAVFLAGLIFADVDDLTDYEKRLQLTIQSLLLWLTILVVPAYSVVMGIEGVSGV